MKEMKYPKVLIFHVLDDGLRARFSLDGDMGPVFENEEQGLEAVKYHAACVSLIQVTSMAAAVAGHSFVDHSQFPVDQQPKSFIIRSDGEWLYPPGEGESADLSPPPATDDKFWDTIQILEGSQTVH